MMEEFGRFEFDPPGSGIDGSRVWNDLQSPLLPFAQSNPSGFVESLAKTTIPIGGWAVYGAARTVANLVDPEFESPAHDSLRNGSLQFLRDNGVPNNRLSAYEWQYWVSHRGGEEPWLVARPLPSDTTITPLDEAEVRRIVQIFPDSDSNIILVRRDHDRYVSVIDARQSEEDPSRVQNDWLVSSSLADLYRQVAESFQIPTFWADPELEVYFPFPSPKI
jgi:hypothetical protein